MNDTISFTRLKIGRAWLLLGGGISPNLLYVNFIEMEYSSEMALMSKVAGFGLTDTIQLRCGEL